jgi:hypothetical protein
MLFPFGVEAETMMTPPIRCRVVRWSVWRPRREEPEPDTAFAGPLFRRRLSLISKMTIKVIHDIMPLEEDTYIYFVSFRGEVNQQFKINKMLIQDGEILPAAFSLSVFNAPPALASMALGLRGGYSAVYPGNGGFPSALTGAAAALEAQAARATRAARSIDRTPGTPRLVLAYADEPLIPEYRELERENAEALAFAALLEAGTPGNAAGSSAAGQPLPSGVDGPGGFLAALEGR